MPFPNGIDGPGQFPGGVGQNQDAQAAQDAEPVFVKVDAQEVVYQPDVSSLVEDSQEETTVLLQEKASTTLGRREAKSRTSSRLEDIVKKYLQRVNQANPTERFQSLVESLKKMGKPTPQQIQQMLQEFSEATGSSSSGVLLALEELLKAEGGHEELLAAVQQAKTSLGTELKDFYQNHIQVYENVSDVYANLLGDYSESDFLNATETMIRRFGQDLQSQGTDADRNRIKATVDSLYHLEIAKNLFSNCATLMEKLKTEFGLVPVTS